MSSHCRQDAYNAAKTGETIKLMEGGQVGSLTANRNVDIFIKGGFAADYTANASQTSLQGAYH